MQPTINYEEAIELPIKIDTTKDFLYFYLTCVMLVYLS